MLAIALYQAALERDDLHEPIYQGLMRCHAAMGSPSESLRVYQRCRSLLNAHLSVEPSLRLRHSPASIRAH